MTSVHVIATPNDKTGRRQEHDRETTIHSRLVSHSARAPSVDDFPVHPICAVAGTLVRFPYVVPQRRRPTEFMPAKRFSVRVKLDSARFWQVLRPHHLRGVQIRLHSSLSRRDPRHP
jgi:hypothetical protein